MSSDQEKREMVFAFYGNYFLLLKEVESSSTQISLKEFLEKKPNLADTILHKLEKQAVKLVEKGLTRHTIVQAILYDFYLNANDMERIKNLNDLLKEKLPALLASTQGLYVACACFTMIDAKDRKGVLKTLKEDIKEMFTNRMAHLFLIHIVSTLDDTTLSKKKIISVRNISALMNSRIRNFSKLLMNSSTTSVTRTYIWVSSPRRASSISYLKRLKHWRHSMINHPARSLIKSGEPKSLR